MRKTEREITSRQEMDSIIRRSKICRLGFVDGQEPYIVPMNFGYDGQVFYFHCAQEGRKLEIMRRNSRVCFEFDILEQIVEGPAGCTWACRYQCVMGTGMAAMIDDPVEKRAALARIMAQYAGDRAFTFPEEAVNRTAIFQVKIDSITGKQTKRGEVA